MLSFKGILENGIIKPLQPMDLKGPKEVIVVILDSQERSPAEGLQKAELVSSIRGKFAHLQTSSEQFALRKQEEIETEGL